jgi:hypothetical protein
MRYIHYDMFIKCRRSKVLILNNTRNMMPRYKFIFVSRTYYQMNHFHAFNIYEIIIQSPQNTNFDFDSN